MQTKKIFATVALIAVFTFGYQSAFSYSTEYHFSQSRQNFAQAFLRTELYFGTDKNDGTQVSIEDWNKFLGDVVTPKFPDGFTVLEGFGQYRTSEGKIVRESSKVLILLYPLKKQKSVSRKIDQIRNAYKKAFQQESVMRMDIRQTVRVAF
jgi:hypothetical protein